MKRKNKLTTAEKKHQSQEIKTAYKQNLADYEQKLKQYLTAAPDHKKPVTRRDFLEVGFWTSSVSLMGPSIETLLQRLSPAHAQALECPAPVAAKSVPFIHFHASGGTMPLAYITPRSTNNELLTNYRRLGLGGVQPTFVTDNFSNGAEVYANDSFGPAAGFNNGWREATTPDIRAKTAAFVIPWIDNGDSDNFPFSIMGLVAAAGQSGQKLGVLGTNASATGNDNGIQSAYNIFAQQPLRVQTLASITNAVTFAGALNNLNAAQKVKLVKTIQGLSEAQSQKIMGYSGGVNAAKLIECATDQTVKNVEDTTDTINPQAFTGMAAIWNNFTPLITAGNKTFDNNVHSMIAYNVINGNAAAGAINIGNHDQHASHRDRAEQEQSAYAIAKQIGQCIATANLLNKKVMIQLTMNGSCVNGQGDVTSKFDNDDNAGDCTGGSLVFMFDPAGFSPATKALQSKFTIGGIVNSTNLNQNGRVDATDPNLNFTANPLLAQTAVFYNYCLFRGDADAFEKVLGSRLTPAQKTLVRKIG